MMDALDPSAVAVAADRWASRLAAGLGPRPDASRLTDFALAMPAHVVGALVGLPEDSQADVAAWTGDLVRCVFPGGRPEEIERGKESTIRLQALVQRHGVSAHAIGFLAQAYDATAALIAATLLTLARRPGLRDEVARAPAALALTITEVLRFDAPVQNTRRFFAESAAVAGHRLPANSTVLVVLAAANRDPAVNVRPDVFDHERTGAEVFTFGRGVHACAGQRLATSIAQAAVARLLAIGVDPCEIDGTPGYRPSLNCRMPLLTWKGKS